MRDPVDKHGRKFFLALLVIALGTITTWLCLWMKVPVPADYVNLLMVGVGAFSATNMGVEFAASRRQTTTTGEPFGNVRTDDER